MSEFKEYLQEIKESMDEIKLIGGIDLNLAVAIAIAAAFASASSKCKAQNVNQNGVANNSNLADGKDDNKPR